ncbi:SHOCT domain-containing protein [bacterium]|nr:SHOCT domain-containing protein [bacterium]
MMGFGLIGTVLGIAVVAYLVGWRPQGNQNLFATNSNKQSPREILDERYARGEISKDEFEQMRADLR